MFNVLTDTFKESLKKSYTKRLSIVWLSACVSVQIILLAIVIPSYVHVIYEDRDVQASATTFSASQTNKTTAIGIMNTFRNTNEKLTILLSRSVLVSLGDSIAQLIILKGTAIKIRGISYQSKTATSSSITLQGVATTREALLSFSKKLEADPLFEKVNLPISNFAKDKNIDFSMVVMTHI